MGNTAILANARTERECQNWQVHQDWREFEPEERSKAEMQVLSPAHSPYSIINARKQIRNKAALKSRGFGAASLLYCFPQHYFSQCCQLINLVNEISRSSLTQTQKAFNLSALLLVHCQHLLDG